MKNRFLIVVVIVVVALSWLVYTAVGSSAKSVVTVAELLTDRSERESVRLGARIANAKIDYTTEPEFLLTFFVRDIAKESGELEVRYYGIMPDTFQEGRDVILEGDFKGDHFVATHLMTQCPSKYEPPKPGETSSY